MQRLTLPERPDWPARLERVGMDWYAATPEHPVPYWAEDACYAFTPAEITRIQADAARLARAVLDATDHAIERGLLGALGLPEFLHGAVRDSWERDDPTVYMRLDLALDADGQVHLLEVNGQTPTSLVEAAVCQWHWLEDRQARGELPGATQWNTVHEALLEQWGHLRSARGVQHVHFAAAHGAHEDFATVQYLRDLATQADLSTSYLDVEDVGASPDRAFLLDRQERDMTHLMWLWPFEFAWEEAFAPHLARTHTRFVEPLWKAVTSSKGLLAVLSDLYAGTRGILHASLHVGDVDGPVVRKPLFSREGQNVTITGMHAQETHGAYADLRVIEQAYVELPTFTAQDGPRYPILGVWVAGDEVCGLGVREGRSRVTDNRASFVPHVVHP
ncbi:glutathionylspermidine synthase family protein [Deinococcus maricopensis]|uniref:Glutathionylspermidine synthase n=1 Tax=Deinococcus maricopensis (strain DSM 21211 / LMG 22137 / NRRL B-23946 / LB-34) TaxID=709986 RepID=E8UAI1_DEIML|nr:glutathionylspermidine synthase family protein [Deinococcus maricopensis]ADV68070.1 glutathionylspermidine synthase [Deinococcus maricopensis DSM 21211]